MIVFCLCGGGKGLPKSFPRGEAIKFFAKRGFGRGAGPPPPHTAKERSGEEEEEEEEGEEGDAAISKHSRL